MAGAWSVIKRQLGYGFRVLIAAFMAVVVIAALYWAWTWFERSRIDRRVSATKTWPELTVPMKTPVLVKLKTKCLNSVLHYQLGLAPKLSPKAAEGEEKGSKIERSEQETAVERLRRDIARYSIEFLDADDFKLIELLVKAEDLSRIVDDQGRPKSLSADGAMACDSVAYDRVSRVTVGWIEAR